MPCLNFTARHRTVSSSMLIAAALLLAGKASATTIDFETQAIGTSISNQYQALGVDFSSPGNPTQPEISTFSGNSTTGNVLADFSVVGGIEIDAAFVAPVTSVSTIAYANPSFVVTMRAYDATNALLGSVSSGGGAFNQGAIGLNGVGLISKVSWTTGSDTAAVGIDNLSFTPAVPEPATWALLATGLLLMAFRRFETRGSRPRCAPAASC